MERVKHNVVRKSVTAQGRKCKGNQGVRKEEGMRKYPCMQERVRCEKRRAHKTD